MANKNGHRDTPGGGSLWQPMGPLAAYGAWHPPAETGSGCSAQSAALLGAEAGAVWGQTAMLSG